MERVRTHRHFIAAAITVTAILFLSLTACSTEGNHRQSRREITSLMDSAQACMYRHNSQALDHIIGIDPQYIHSRKIGARYALLYSEALNVNRIPASDDSLIMIAVRYYSTGKDPFSQFRSLYTLGCIYDDLGQPTDAAVALGQAEQMAGSTGNSYLTGLMYSRFGKVYGKFYDYPHARECFTKAVECFSDSETRVNRAGALYDLACCDIDMLDFQTADSILIEVQQWAQENSDPRLYANSLVSRMACAIYAGTSDSLHAVFDRYVEKFGEPRNDFGALGLFALYHVRLKEFDKAQAYLDKARGRIRSKSDAINLNFQNSRLFESMGLPDSALVYHKKYVSLQNEKTREILGHPALGAQKDYFKTVAEVESIRSSRNSRTIVLLSISFLLAIMVFWAVARSRKLKLEADKQDLMLTIRELRLKEDSSSATINQLGKRVNTLFSRQYAELDQVFDKMAELDEKEAIYSEMKNSKQSDRHQEKTENFYSYISSRLEELKSERNQEELDTIINSTFDNLMLRISESPCSLTDEDLIILRLSIAGFSVRTISRIMGITPKNIYQKRTRMLAKISKAAPELGNVTDTILKSR